jgi:predicted ATPase
MWALAEIVKAEAGILETDTPAAAAGKLAKSVAAIVEEDADWVARHLRPLVGLGADSSDAPRTEAFAAWRRYLEAIAGHGPLVLVFEDIHWADANLLDFIDHLIDWATAVPLLVVCTARPELLDGRPTWGGGKRNATTLSLTPLSDSDTAQLVAALLERNLLVAEAQDELVTRAGGNPLYAEQFVRMLGERDARDLPETVHGVIASRLDALSAEEKAVLQDAAVLGKVFWLGAVAGIGERDRGRTEEQLHGLERKEFVRRALRSSVGDDAEYAFAHVLVRDVAYRQIPRAARAEKHRAAAEWIESLGRPEESAEMLAHHYSSALEFAVAAGRADATLLDRTRRALREAGDRAAALSAFAAAAAFFGRALEHWPREDPARAQLLFAHAEALHESGDERREQALEEARDALLAAGDREAAAEAEALLAAVSWLRGRGAECAAHLDRALELAAASGVTPARARVLAEAARYRMLAADYEAARPLAREACNMAQELGLTAVQGHALVTLGVARAMDGDDSGRDDIEAGLALALEHNLPTVAGRAYNNLSVLEHDVAATLELVTASEAVYLRLGDAQLARYARANRTGCLLQVGHWDEALELADEFLAECDAGNPHYQEPDIRTVRALIRYGRDDPAGALSDAQVAVELARDARDPQIVCPVLSFAAQLSVYLGLREDALAFADEALASMQGHWAEGLTLVARSLGLENRLRHLFVPGRPWENVSIAMLEHRWADAAAIAESIHNPTWGAEIRLTAAETLVEEGRRDEAVQLLDPAVTFFRSVGATRFMERAESLLATPTL